MGSAHDSHQDQVLDEILVGPVPVGLNKFVLQADAPDPSKLPPHEVLGVTVVLVTCSYQEKEFVRVGFYVNNEYLDPEYLASTTAAAAAATAAAAAPTDPAAGSDPENVPPPENVLPPKTLPSYPDLKMEWVQRHILADKPRVTKFPISWGTDATTAVVPSSVAPSSEPSPTTVAGADHHPGTTSFAAAMMKSAGGGMAMMEGTAMDVE